MVAIEAEKIDRWQKSGNSNWQWQSATINRWWLKQQKQPAAAKAVTITAKRPQQLNKINMNATINWWQQLSSAAATKINNCNRRRQRATTATGGDKSGNNQLAVATNQQQQRRRGNKLTVKQQKQLALTKAVTIKPSDRTFYINNLSKRNNQLAATTNQKLSVRKLIYDLHTRSCLCMM